MALTRKRPFLLGLHPDIAVIPECSSTSVLEFANAGFDARWFGDKPSKGVGVLVSSPWRIASTDEPRNKWVVPIWVTGPSDFLLLAVWTSKVGPILKKNYIGQMHEAVMNNPQWFKAGPVILCGDFNSNSIWDAKRKIGNHTDVVKRLHEFGIVSAYHQFFSEQQGAETRPTHFLYHQEKRSFHIDYIFLPEEWARRIKMVTVGQYAEWSSLSDHVPVTVDLP